MHPAEIKKTFIYSDDIQSGTEIQDHLEECLPAELRGTGDTPIFRIGL